MNHGYARRDGQIFLFLGCLIFLVSSAILLRVNRTPLRDFRMVYSGSRCLLHGSDPYIQGNVLRVYREEVDRQSTDSERDLLVVSRIVYLPSVFVVGLLFAALPFALAQTLWAAALAALFMVAAWMVWDLAADSSPILAGIVLCFCLGNSESIVLFGNPGSIAVSLAVIAAWSFLRHRFVPLGISCLAIGLAVKPHDTFFLWLCFLLAGGAFRSAALKSLFLSLAVSLPVTLYVFYLAPHWVPELRANLQGFFAPGSTNDPAGFHGTCAITSLQAITSYFWPDPRVYNLVAYFLSAPLIVVWAFITFRSRPTLNAARFALATIAPLSMLPVYHCQYDAKLILLAVPALCLLWQRGGRTAWGALIVSGFALVLNGDLPWSLLLMELNRHSQLPTDSAVRPINFLLNAPVPLTLLAMGGFYLWVYARSSIQQKESNEQIALGGS
ncbi:MAG: hypothetical protein WBY75_02330 [Terracidiphilus sp.]